MSRSFIKELNKMKERIAKGICSTAGCGKELLTEWYCKDCASRKNESQKVRYQRLIRDRRCSWCRKLVEDGVSSLCDFHLKRIRELNKKYKNKA